MRRGGEKGEEGGGFCCRGERERDRFEIFFLSKVAGPICLLGTAMWTGVAMVCWDVCAPRLIA